MPDRAEQLNQVVDRVILDPSATPAIGDRELDALVDLARDLKHLPREEFRSDLMNQLERTDSMTTTSYIPAGLGAVTPYLLVRNPAAAIDFYCDVFGATEIMRHEHEGHVVHAKVRIGDSMVELGEHGQRTGADADLADLPPSACTSSSKMSTQCLPRRPRRGPAASVPSWTSTTGTAKSASLTPSASSGS